MSSADLSKSPIPCPAAEYLRRQGSRRRLIPAGRSRQTSGLNTEAAASLRNSSALLAPKGQRHPRRRRSSPEAHYIFQPRSAGNRGRFLAALEAGHPSPRAIDRMVRAAVGDSLWQWPEFISPTTLNSAKERTIHRELIQPGNPQQNAYVERFNRTVRYEWLSQYHSKSLSEVRPMPLHGCGLITTTAQIWNWVESPQSSGRP